MSAAIGQHKRLAMGQSIGNYARGGRAAILKTGLPTTPITDAKRANGVPGFKGGGKDEVATMNDDSGPSASARSSMMAKGGKAR